MSSKQEESKKIAALSAGIVIAVGVAGWNINNALNPPAPSATSSAAPAAVPAAPPGEGAVANAPANTASGLPAAEGAQATGRVARGRNEAEAELAPGIDPFRPSAASTPEVRIAQLPTAPVIRPLDRASLRGNGAGPGYLPPAGGVDFSHPERRQAAAAAEPAPKLIGTLLGDQPSAVFGTEGAVTVVPVGGRIGTWKVVAVDHGSALVRSSAQTRYLKVTGAARGSIAVQTAPEPVDLPSAAPPERVASMASASPMDQTPSPEAEMSVPSSEPLVPAEPEPAPSTPALDPAAE